VSLKAAKAYRTHQDTPRPPSSLDLPSQETYMKQIREVLDIYPSDTQWSMIMMRCQR
jgi:hypothetical protein